MDELMNAWLNEFALVCGGMDDASRYEHMSRLEVAMGRDIDMRQMENRTHGYEAMPDQQRRQIGYNNAIQFSGRILVQHMPPLIEAGSTTNDAELQEAIARLYQAARAVNDIAKSRYQK